VTFSLWSTSGKKTKKVISFDLFSGRGNAAPVERLFSIAGKVFRPDRMHIKDETFETIMMLKCNCHLV
jgi:hypothetical protein